MIAVHHIERHQSNSVALGSRTFHINLLDKKLNVSF